VNERNWVATVLAIDQEIRIEREDGVPLVEFGHPHDTGIS